MNNINEMDLPVYKLVINDEDDTGVEFVSLVTNPESKETFSISTNNLLNLKAERVKVIL